MSLAERLRLIGDDPNPEYSRLDRMDGLPRHRAGLSLTSRLAENSAPRGPIKHRQYVQSRLNDGKARHRADVPADVHWRKP